MRLGSEFFADLLPENRLLLSDPTSSTPIRNGITFAIEPRVA